MSKKASDLHPGGHVCEEAVLHIHKSGNTLSPALGSTFWTIGPTAQGALWREGSAGDGVQRGVCVGVWTSDPVSARRSERRSRR